MSADGIHLVCQSPDALNHSLTFVGLFGYAVGILVGAFALHIIRPRPRA